MYDKVTLANVCHGAAEELFKHEMQKVMANIKDPSTDAKKKRTITLTFSVDPLKDRSGGTISCVSKSVTVPVSPVVSTIHLAGEGDAVQAYQPNTEQAGLFEMSKPVAVNN